MDDNASTMFIFLVVFWVLLAVFSNVFAVELSKTDITNKDNSGFTIEPLLNLMSFKYTDGVPVILAIFLDTSFIFTLFIGYSLIRG